MVVGIENIVNNCEYFEPEALDQMVFTIKKTEDALQPVFTKTVEKSQVINFEPQDTAQLDYGAYVYDIKVIMDDGKVFTVIGPAHIEILPF